MARQRHNIGFMAMDAIASRHGFSPWRQRFKGLIAEGTVGRERVLALKPLTYMNASGESVQAASAFFKIPSDAITAFHDELDLVPGKVRVGTQDYWRVRLGIGHPGHKDRVTGHVLGDFSKDDQKWLPALLDAVADTAPLLASGESEAFMTKVALLAPA
jgi:PTH1 family peptidyl-tRNA hydrolase